MGDGEGRCAIVAKMEVEIDRLGGFESRVLPHMLPFTIQSCTQIDWRLSEAGNVLQ